MFAAWLVAPKNPWFARAAVNRVWFWLMGRGIVHEPDDIRPDNAPVNAPLLALLEREFQASRFDVKQLVRLILNSTTYQLSSIPLAPGPEAEANFAHALARPRCRGAGGRRVRRDGNVGPVLERDPGALHLHPPGRAGALAPPDGSIRSAFLETFGRPSRDTGLLSERNSRPSASQRLYMLNSTDVQRKIQQGPKIQALLQTRGTAAEMVAAFYLTILSRVPTSERAAAGDGLRPGAGLEQAPGRVRLAWH